jgi:hypothetical protein
MTVLAPHALKYSDRSDTNLGRDFCAKPRAMRVCTDTQIKSDKTRQDLVCRVYPYDGGCTSLSISIFSYF